MHAGDRPKDMAGWMRRVEQLEADLDQRVRSVGLRYGAANQVATTNASGIASFAHGAGILGTPVVVASGGNGEQVSVVSVNGFSFNALFTDGVGAPLASQLVRCLWIALPPTIT